MIPAAFQTNAAIRESWLWNLRDLWLRPLLSVHDELGAADGDGVAGAQRRGGGDAGAVDEGAVAAAQVLDGVAVALAADDGVAAAFAGILGRLEQEAVA